MDSRIEDDSKLLNPSEYAAKKAEEARPPNAVRNLRARIYNKASSRTLPTRKSNIDDKVGINDRPDSRYKLPHKPSNKPRSIASSIKPRRPQSHMLLSSHLRRVAGKNKLADEIPINRHTRVIAASVSTKPRKDRKYLPGYLKHEPSLAPEVNENDEVLAAAVRDSGTGGNRFFTLPHSDLSRASLLSSTMLPFLETLKLQGHNIDFSGGKFYYLSPVTSAYDLKIAKHSEVNSASFFMLTKTGVVHTMGDDVEFTSMEQYDRERFLFKLVNQLVRTILPHTK